MYDDRVIYRDGIPFIPVTFPANRPDGIIIEDLQIQQLIDYVNKNNLKKAYIQNVHNYEFLKECIGLEHIRLQLRLPFSDYGDLQKKGERYIKVYDVDALYSLVNLKSLEIIDTENPIITSKMSVDLSRFSKLEYYSGEYGYICNLGQAKHLKFISFSHYKKADLSELRDLEQLDTIEMVQSGLCSLDGCERLKKLQCLYLHYNRRLSDISALREVKDSLRALRIENCPKIKDFSVLGELENLELLELTGSNELPNLDFIKTMKNLKTFTFTMNVLDGDLSPCLNLSYVYSEKNRKHYNIKDAMLPKNAYVRGNEDIEEWRRRE